MHNTAKPSRFLIDFSSRRKSPDWGINVGQDDLLRHILASKFLSNADARQALNGLASELIQLAEHFFGLRDNDSLRGASSILQNLPIVEGRIIGLYYRALAVRRSGKIDESLRLLAIVADHAPLEYRARALQTLGAVHHALGQPQESLRFYSEASRAASNETSYDLLTTLLVNLEACCIKSEMGDHSRALVGYEKLARLVQIVARQHPLYFYLYHNELAIELAEVGHLAEAQAASAIALASPFARAYPEWSETRDEIAAKCKSTSPSFVAIHRTPQGCPRTLLRQYRAPGTRRTIRGYQAYHVYHFFQRATFQFPAKAVTVLNAVSILQRMLGCTGPRPPPPC
jgi:tetratricopeptide (TPR) repeat protein